MSPSCSCEPSSHGKVVLARAADGTLTVEHADPAMWFAQHTLDALLANPDAAPGELGWVFDGQYVTLTADNGRWVWKLTGRTRRYDYPHGHPLILAEAVWPD